MLAVVVSHVCLTEDCNSVIVAVLVFLLMTSASVAPLTQMLGFGEQPVLDRFVVVPHVQTILMIPVSLLRGTFNSLDCLPLDSIFFLKPRLIITFSVSLEVQYTRTASNTLKWIAVKSLCILAKGN